MDVRRRIAELEAELAGLRAAARGEGPADLAATVVARLEACREVLAQLPHVVTVLDREHRILFLNRTVIGRSADSFVGECLLDHLVEAERESRRAALEASWASREVQRLESRSASGFSWENRLVPIVDEGRTVAMLTTSVEISDRKSTEDALRASATALRHALDATGLGTWTRDARGVAYDDALCAILGVPAGTTSPDPDGFLSFVHPEDRGWVRERVELARRTGRFDELACRIERADGVTRHVLVNAALEVDDEGRFLRSFGGILDVTERHRLEERLRHAEKMDAIGHLTAGIAHNFNNILGVILPNVELARRHAEGKVAQRLEHIQQAAERGADMVRQLMLFARADAVARMEPTDLAACATRTVGICRSSFDAAIRLELVIPPDLPNVVGNAGQLQQVLLNVCLNARDALLEARPKAPRIEIRLERATPDRVRIVVNDNGPGMDEATRSRIFDPFFTTKDAQHGTGLGLPSVLAIVTDHRGSVTCESRIGAGTSIVIELPATCEAAPNELPRPSIVPEGRATETVLLADDEPLVRDATRALLERGGYEVLEARDGAEALLAFGEHRARIAAVILDRSMPELSGEKVLGELATAAPEVPVVMLSGHLGGDEDWTAASAVLHKPTDEATLLATLRDVIDARRGRETRSGRR